MYELRFDQSAVDIYRQADGIMIKRFNRCFEYLRENPFIHPNIKSLTGQLKGLYRYRMGDWRIIYEVNSEEQIVNILQIIHRSKAYRTL